MIFKLAKQKEEDSRDMKGGSILKDSEGKLVSERKKVLTIWKKYFSGLLNPEGVNNRNIDYPLSVRKKVEGKEISEEEVRRAVRRMKKGKSTGEDEFKIEMVEAAGELGTKWMTKLLNKCRKEGSIPKEWRVGLVVPIWKKKGDAQDPGNYRGITLLSHGLKVLERIVDRRCREAIEKCLGEEQQGFRAGRGTTDGVFTISQMMEKVLEKKKLCRP